MGAGERGLITVTDLLPKNYPIGTGASSLRPSSPQVCGGEGDGRKQDKFMDSMRELLFRRNLFPKESWRKGEPLHQLHCSD